MFYLVYLVINVQLLPSGSTFIEHNIFVFSINFIGFKEGATNWRFSGATKKTFMELPSVIFNDFVVTNDFFIFQTVCVDAY